MLHVSGRKEHHQALKYTIWNVSQCASRCFEICKILHILQTFTKLFQHSSVYILYFLYMFVGYYIFFVLFLKLLRLVLICLNIHLPGVLTFFFNSCSLVPDDGIPNFRMLNMVVHSQPLGFEGCMALWRLLKHCSVHVHSQVCYIPQRSHKLICVVLCDNERCYSAVQWLRSFKGT